jgi:glycosyltransferase involved in cell wall biosynthesis
VNCFKKADNLFTLGAHLDKAIQVYSDKPSTIIPNWVNSDFVKPMDKKENTFAIQHQLTDKLVVMYSGNLGLTHNIEAIVETAEFLKENKDIHFVIIGEGAKKVKIEKMVYNKKLDNVLLLPYQDKEVLPFSLSCADIGVVTLSEGAEMISVPSKTYYTLAAGSLILALASKESELGVLIENYECGKVFENPKVVDVANFIIELSNDEKKLKKLKENARNTSRNYTPENAQRYYDYIYGKN